MKRLSLTLFTTLALFGVYRVYAHVMSPMTKAKLIPVAPPTERIEGSGHASHAAREAARQFLSAQPWAQQAKFTWEHLDQKFIYFDEIGPVTGKGQTESKNQYRFRPFAMIVRNPSRPDEPPTVLAADEARVTFKDKIDQLSAGDSGGNRIIGAELDSGVTLTGPNGLSMKGSNFVFSEATRSLYSDEPLQFTYGPTAKSATRFVGDAEDFAMILQGGENDFLGKDLPQISDFEHLTLRRNVRFRIDYDNKGHLTPVQISSAGSFEFNRQERLASFERDVNVKQRTSRDDEPAAHNILDCQRLELRFDEAPAVPVASSKPERSTRQKALDEKVNSLAGLTLHYLVALSPRRQGEELQRVRLLSDENSLSAEMEQLQFDVAEGVLSITDPAQSTVERFDAKAKTTTRLLTRRMLLGLEQEPIPIRENARPAFRPVRKKFGTVDWVVCAGMGKLIHLDDTTGETLLTAIWKEKLSLKPDENASDRATADRLLELVGEATVHQGIDQAVRSDVLTLTLPASLFQTSEAERKPDSPKQLLLRRAHAHGHVEFALKLEDLEAEGTTNDLIVMLTEGVPPVSSPQEKPVATEGEKLRKKVRLTPFWNLASQRIEADVIVNPETRDAGVRTATVEGPLRISRPALVKGATDTADGPVEIAGHKLKIINAGLDRQTAVLVGRMHGGKSVERARITAGEASLEGQQIEIDRARSTMNVTGTTEVLCPVSGDMTGRKLQTAMMMSVGCADGLTFDGQNARFSRSVVVRLDEQSRMYCEDLIVGLNKPWSPNPAAPDAPPPEVSVIRSPGRVKVEMREFEKNALSRVMSADLGQFEMHPQKADGSFKGAGPGTIKQWQRGSFHFRVAPEASAAANKPASSAELPWNFVQLDFEGELTGNIHQRFATFNERVKAIYAPVAQAQTPFERRELSSNSESAKRAVWVGCDVLNVSLSEPKPGAETGFITLNAQGHVELEAQKVQANAYQISFEEEKDIFELRGRGEEMASVYVEGGPQRGHVPGKVIQFNPRTGAHRIVEAGTVTGGN